MVPSASSDTLARGGPRQPSNESAGDAVDVAGAVADAPELGRPGAHELRAAHIRAAHIRTATSTRTVLARCTPSPPYVISDIVGGRGDAVKMGQRRLVPYPEPQLAVALLLEPAAVRLDHAPRG